MHELHATNLNQALARSANVPFQMSLPTFSGTDNFTSWMNDVELKFNALKIPEENRTAWIITALRGVALQTVMSNNHEDVASILRTLREAFVPKNQAISLRNDLLTLKQKGNDFQTFLFSFNTLLAGT